MRTGRPTLELGAHGTITTRIVASGATCAIARLRLWDGDLHRVTATADTAPDARELLKLRIAERLRLSELDAWRYLTAHDPFDELVYVWLGDLAWCSEASDVSRALCERIVRTQLMPTFGELTIGEITAERIEQHLAILRSRSEEAAADSHEAIELLLDFAVGEGVLSTSPMGVAARDEGPSRLGDLRADRALVHGRIELRREEHGNGEAPAGE